MRNRDPRFEARATGALLTVVAGAYALHAAYEWVAPLVPVAISGIVMLVLFRFLFRRR